MRRTEVPSKNLIAIQILRCLAALLVVVHHSHFSIRFFEHTYWSEGAALSRAVHYPSWANHLDAGVDIFFCISGFIMCMLADRARSNNRRSFIVDRFARILPPYWLFTTIIIAVYLVSPRFNAGELTGDWGYNAVRIVKSLFLIPQNKMPVLKVGWTLVHEFLFYYFVALLIFFKQGQRTALFMAVAAAAGIVLCLVGTDVFYGYWLSPFYVEFFLGALVYRIYDRISYRYPGVQLTIAFFLYFVVSALLEAYQPFVLHTLIRMFGFGTMGFFLISGLMGLDAKYKMEMYFLPRLLARIGDASYSLYLSHWFVLSFLGRFAVLIPGAPVFLIIIWHIGAIVTAVVFAVLFAEHVELAFHRKLLNYLKSRRKDAVHVDCAR